MPDAPRHTGLDVDALYVRHHQPLLSWFVRRTADTQIALDLWAETFAQATASRHRYRGRTDGEAAAWLYTIAKRQLINYHRRGRTEQRMMRRLGMERFEADDAMLASIERQAGLDKLREEIAAGLAALSAPVRAAVELRVVHELDYGSVASRLGISEPAARARVSRGLLALADVLDNATIKEALSP